VNVPSSSAQFADYAKTAQFRVSCRYVRLPRRRFEAERVSLEIEVLVGAHHDLGHVDRTRHAQQVQHGVGDVVGLDDELTQHGLAALEDLVG